MDGATVWAPGGLGSCPKPSCSIDKKARLHVWKSLAPALGTAQEASRGEVAPGYLALTTGSDLRYRCSIT